MMMIVQVQRQRNTCTQSPYINDDTKKGEKKKKKFVVKDLAETIQRGKSIHDQLE